MTGFKKVAVVGASGLLGQPIVKQLAAAGFELTLISRETSKLKSVFPYIKAKFAHADPSDPKSIREAFTGLFQFFLGLMGRNRGGGFIDGDECGGCAKAICGCCCGCGGKAVYSK
jgi:uncharacterized protein YbjT (DUF2867 family)